MGRRLGPSHHRGEGWRLHDQPEQATRTLNFGVVDNDFYLEPNAAVPPNRRPVQWLQTGVARDPFSTSVLHDIGSAFTLFRVENHAAEFLQVPKSDGPGQTIPAHEDNAVDLAEDQPNADRVDPYSRDLVVDILRHMHAYRLRTS